MDNITIGLIILITSGVFVIFIWARYGSRIVDWFLQVRFKSEFFKSKQDVIKYQKEIEVLQNKLRKVEGNILSDLPTVIFSEKELCENNILNELSLEVRSNTLEKSLESVVALRELSRTKEEKKK